MPCEDNTHKRMPLPAVPTDDNRGYVTLTRGVPSPSTPDQSPVAYDESTGILYLNTGTWTPTGLYALSEVNLSNITNLDNVLRIPVAYTAGNERVQGYITLKDFKKLINER